MAWFHRIPISFVLGAFAALLFAWGCARWSPLTDNTSLLIQLDSRVDGWMGSRTRGFGLQHVTVFGARGLTQHGLDEATIFPPWIDDPADRPLDERVVFQVKAGWPLRAVVGWRDGVGDHNPIGGVYRSGLGPQRIIWGDWHWARASRDQATGGMSFEEARPIPFAIRWKAFAINTVVFAGPIVVLFLLGDVRRLIRRRRGCCPTCGYDLKHNSARGCPECGWNRCDGAPAEA